MNVPSSVLNFLASIDAAESRQVSSLLMDHLVTFRLGEVLADVDALDATALWLVCEGRVRLVMPDQTDVVESQGISLAVLEPDDWFGFETALDFPVSYRAIAATDVQVTRLRAAEWQSLIASQPALKLRLSEVAQQRQQIANWKCHSNLGRSGLQLNSQQLTALLPAIVTVPLSAETKLADCAEIPVGYCWYFAAELAGTLGALPPIGEPWQHPAETGRDWQAVGDGLIYCLPQRQWVNVAGIAPRLADWLAVQPIVDQSPIPLPKHRLNRLHLPGKAITTGLLNESGSRGTHPPQPIGLASSHVVDFPTPQKPRKNWLPAFLRQKAFIQQQSSSDCGVACLAMIGQYWGQRYPIHMLREMSQVGRSGATLKNIATTAERLGFQSRPVQASFNRMAVQKHPWIAHWQGDHYVVVYQVRGRKVQVADPATGKTWMAQSAFIAGWTSYALLLEPTEALKPVDDRSAKNLGTFGRVLWQFKGLLGQIILLSLLLQIFGLVPPLFTQVILDQVVSQKSLSALNLFSIGLLIFSVWSIGLGTVRQYLLDFCSNRLQLTLVSGFVSHTLRLPLKFFEDRSVGDILTRVGENSKIQQFLVRQAVSTWLDASMGAVYLGLMLYYNWQLTLVALATIPLMMLLTLGATPFLKQLSRDVFKASSDQTSQMVEMMNGIATVKATAAEQEIRWRWEDGLVGLLNVQFKAQKFTNGLGAVSGLINAIGGVVMLWFGANLVIQNQLTIGQFVAFNMLIGRVTGPVMSVIGIWDEFQEVVIAIERLNDVFAATPEEAVGQPMMVLPPIDGAVRFDNVMFKYDGAEDRPILQNITFTVDAGQTIAIVGRSGSGKSTLVKLIQGLYQPTQGRVLVDGHDLRHVSPQSLRSQIGSVPQDCFLFSGTILDNIRMHRPDYPLTAVVAAAKLAEAHAFIQDLPLGYNTKVGERGANLSGGQRQRIAIARALLGEPALLLLDEATSSLDTESERRFQQNLERISRSRTTFIIAHRLSTVQSADQILVIDRGILVEQGSHTRLMQTQGLYYHLAQQQLTL